MGADIPVSVIVATRNEARNLPRCLAALKDFGEVIVLDSCSDDGSAAIAAAHGAIFIPFRWDGKYPKKRQWALNHLVLRHERVLFVDADEEMTTELAAEIAALSWDRAGYFVDGLYVVHGQALRRGARNRKLCLFDRRLMEFPVVDDLDIPGMGEIEGHYQPAAKKTARNVKTGRLKNPLFHHCMDDIARWNERHEGYAAWEAEMIHRRNYPAESVGCRQAAKEIFRALPFRGAVVFIYFFILKGGFLEGERNLRLSLKKAQYYINVSSRTKCRTAVKYLDE